MKVSAASAAGFCAKPPDGVKAALIHGPDAVAVAQHRQALIRGLAGPDAEADMRLTRIDAASARSDPAGVADALRAQGFFPGRRVVWIADGTDALAPLVEAALAAASPSEAWLLVTANVLNAKGKLRGLFEGARDAAAIACYGEPPDRATLQAMLDNAGCAVTPEGLRALQEEASALDAGALAQFVETLTLYKLGENEPLSAEDVAASAPTRAADGADEAASAVADRQPEALRAAAMRLAAQGVDPIQIVGATLRRFMTLHAIAVNGGDAEGTLSRMRPPVFGPRRDVIARQSRRWSGPAVEAALLALHEVDAELRSSSAAPRAALMERALLRIALTPER